MKFLDMLACKMGIVSVKSRIKWEEISIEYFREKDPERSEISQMALEGSKTLFDELCRIIDDDKNYFKENTANHKKIKYIFEAFLYMLLDVTDACNVSLKYKLLKFLKSLKNSQKEF